MRSLTPDRALSRRALALLVVLNLALAASCTRLAKKKLADHDLAFDADTMVSVAGEGAAEDVRLFLAAGMNPDVEGRLKDSSADITPLMAAAQGCHADVARLLLDAGADAKWVSGSKESALHAIADGCAESTPETARQLARMLLDAGAEIDALDQKYETPLLRALSRENVGVVAVLVEHGADLRKSGRRSMSAIAIAREPGYGSPEKMTQHEEIARIIEAAAARARAEAATVSTDEAEKRLAASHYKFDQDGIKLAAARNDVEALQYYLRLDAPAEWRAAALSEAARTQQKDAAELLLAKGVKPDTDALLAAIQAGDLAQLRSLTASGVKLDATGEWGATPLTAAAKKGWYDAVVLLLDAGAGVDVPDRSGDTPLLAAAQSPSIANDARTVKLLVSRGAQVNMVGSRQVNPAYLVAARGNPEALQALIDAGADVSAHASLLGAALGSQANSDRKEQTLAVLYRIVDGWNETERIEKAKEDISWVMSHTSVRGGGLNSGNRSARVTIGGSGQYDTIPADRLIDVCHEVAPHFGLGCCWLERVDAYSAAGTKLGEFRFDRARGWSFTTRR